MTEPSQGPARDPARDSAHAPHVATDRILTIPNMLSFLRLLGVPVLLYLVLGPHDDRVAFVLLMASGATDYLDGYLARRLDQISKIGTLLDPLADRLYIFATVLALAIRGITPVWLIVVLAARDVYMAGLLPLLRRHGYGPLPVSYLGKAATLNLLYAFPLLLLSSGHDGLATFARPLGWAFTLWGTALYLLAAGLYTQHLRLLIRPPHTVYQASRPVQSPGSAGSTVSSPQDSPGGHAR